MLDPGEEGFPGLRGIVVMSNAGIAQRRAGWHRGRRLRRRSRRMVLRWSGSERRMIGEFGHEAGNAIAIKIAPMPNFTAARLNASEKPLLSSSPESDIPA